MRKRLQLILGLSDERGATAIIIGLLMVVFIGVAAVAVDIGYAMATRNELQNIADGAALAATGQIGDNYSGMSTNELLNYVVDGAEETFLQGIAKDVANNNQAGGVGNIILNDSDIEIGKWDGSIEADDIDDSLRGTVNDPRFTPTLDQPDAVRVTVRRESSANGPISTFFSRIFGLDVVSVNAIATAALTGIDEVDECELYVPVGISSAWFDFYNNDRDAWCDQNIRLHPTGTIEGCAGWHTFDQTHSANNLRQLLRDGISGVCQDGASTGEELEFTGGDIGSAFPLMEDLYNLMRDCQSGSPAIQALLLEMQEDDPTLTEADILDLCQDGDGVPIDLEGVDGDPDTWTTHVAIYGYGDCANPKQTIPIVGFATIQIYEVIPPSDKIINARVKCLGYGEGRGGGGGKFGTMGTIPGLVQ